jgi:hypothetical protein
LSCPTTEPEEDFLATAPIVSQPYPLEVGNLSVIMGFF